MTEAFQDKARFAVFIGITTRSATQYWGASDIPFGGARHTLCGVVAAPDGRIALRLKRPFSDGTTHILFTPEDFVARLAALVPRPHHNLTRYHGVFAPASPFRSRVTPAGAGGRRRSRTSQQRKGEGSEAVSKHGIPTEEPVAPLTWAQRLRRVFDIDISTCPFCGGSMRVICDVTDPGVINRILGHLRSRGESRAPPGRAEPRSPDLLSTAG